MKPKKLFCLCLCMSLLLLAACQGGKNSGQELALDIRATLLKASSFQTSADIAADYGDCIYTFTVTFTSTADGGTLDVTAPDELKGIHADVSKDGAAITFDGASLDMGALTGDGLSPMEVLPVLWEQWKTGYISGCNYEKLNQTNALAVNTNVTEKVTSRTWFDVATRLPVRAELYDGGKRVISVDFKDVAIQ